MINLKKAALLSQKKLLLVDNQLESVLSILLC